MDRVASYKSGLALRLPRNEHWYLSLPATCACSIGIAGIIGFVLVTPQKGGVGAGAITHFFVDVPVMLYQRDKGQRQDKAKVKLEPERAVRSD